MDNLARGDEITDVGMNIQPVLLLGIVVFFLVGIVPLLRLLWVVSGLILLGMFVYFVYSAVKISVKFHDWVCHAVGCALLCAGGSVVCRRSNNHGKIPNRER